MAVPLILCRLKDDHSVVHLIGETTLIHFSDWEPVPDDQRKLIEDRDAGLIPPDAPIVPEEKSTGQKPRAAKTASSVAKKDGE